MDWNEAWGDREDFDFDDSLTELEGLKPGDRVRAIEDLGGGGFGDLMNAYEGDEGVVIGFSKLHPGGGVFNTPARSHEVYVAWDDVDPNSVDPTGLEKL